MRARKTGAIPPNRLGVYDHRGRLKGIVTGRATSVTAARFTGVHGAELVTIGGRRAWKSPPPKSTTR